MSTIEENQQLSSPWSYQGSFDFEVPPKAIAFLYKIVHLETGKWYIGRKGLFKTAYKQIKGKKKKLKVESDWKSYWSSSDEINALVESEGEAAFKREILLFVETDAATLYSEESLLYMSGALFDPNCFNNNIRAKVYRKWFANKETDLHQRLLDCLK